MLKSQIGMQNRVYISFDMFLLNLNFCMVIEMKRAQMQAQMRVGS